MGAEQLLPPALRHTTKWAGYGKKGNPPFKDGLVEKVKGKGTQGTATKEAVV